DLRLLARSLAGLERVLEQAADHRARGLSLPREPQRLLDLCLDLRLPENHRVQPRGDAEEVAGCRTSLEAVEVRLELRRRHPGVLREAIEERLLPGLAGRHGIQLGAIAGAEEPRLA